jgi:predicted xylan-binding protein with Ca-dependent carbohydrate-binding module
MGRKAVLALTATGLTVALGGVGIALADTADAPPGSPFRVVNGSIRPATGTPIPASGTHAALWGNSSYATTTVEGSGQVLIGATGVDCGGWPVVRVEVDGRHVGDTRIVSASHYGSYPVGAAVGAGRHVVRISFTNDHRDASCDRNVHIAYARMAQPGAAPTPARPGPANTGVPDGTALRVHHGDLTITRDGTVVDGLDVHGFVNVRADDVTIRRSILRGADPGTVNKSIVAAYGDHRNLVIEDTTIVGAVRSGYLDGLKGRNFTARRLDISGVVDTVLVFGDHTVVRDSWLHDNTHITPWPLQPDNQTHDDSIQFEGGTDILIENNTIEGAHNAGLMVTQNYARSSGIRLVGNWIGGGGCTVNLAEKGKGPITDVLIQDNRFGPSRVANCGVIAPPTSTPRMVNNVYAQTGAPVVPRRGA